MTIYSVGYGGRTPDDFVRLLQERGVRRVVDVRLRPDRASMGAYVRAKDPQKGIQGLLGRAGIRYVFLLELGNLFLDFPEDWKPRYAALFARAGDLLLTRLYAMIDEGTDGLCLLCAERDPTRCHREIIAGRLTADGHRVVHVT